MKVTQSPKFYISHISTSGKPNKTSNNNKNEKIFGQDVVPIVTVSKEKEKSFGENTTGINDTYTHDYNIISVDTKIKRYLRSKHNNINSINAKLDRLADEYLKTSSITGKIHLKNEIIILNEEKVKIERSYEEYENKTRNYITKYKDLKLYTPKIYFGSSLNLEDDPYREQRLLTISKYLNIASYYYNLNIRRCNDRTTGGKKCNICGLNTEKSVGGRLCPKGHWFPISNNQKYVYNYDVTSKPSYNRSETFEDAFLSYQGLQKDKPPQEVYDTIQNSMNSYKIKPKDLEEDVLLEILKENKLSSQYHNMRLIFHNITGAKLPDLSDLRNRIMRRHEIIESVYHKEKTKDRKNFLDGQYMLWSILKMENYSCKKSEFSMLKTEDVIKYHDDTMERILHRLRKENDEFDWPFYPAL